MGNGKKFGLIAVIAVVLVMVMALMAPAVAWEPDADKMREEAESYPVIYGDSSGPETITDTQLLIVVLSIALVMIFLAFLLLLREKRKTEELANRLKSKKT